MGDFTSVFDEAGFSAEQAAADRAMAQAKQASLDLQTYYLNAAESEDDFNYRLAMAEGELTKAANSAGVSVHALIAEHTKEFGLLMEARRVQASMPALPDQADDDHDSDDRTSWERWGDQPLHEMDPGDAQDNWYRGDYLANLQSIRTALAEGVDPLEWIEEEGQGEGQPEKPSQSGQSAWQEGYEGSDNGIGRTAAAPVQDGLFDAPSKPTQTPLDIPDQYGRRWSDDDGESKPPRNPGLESLPPLRPWWGPRRRA